MKFSSLSFFICLSIVLIGCGNKVYNEPLDKYPFEDKMKSVLGKNLGTVANRDLSRHCSKYLLMVS